MLRLLSRAKVLFYCHFPDQLLTKRDSTLKYLYRLPIDWLEEVSTGLAHVVVVNSKFTAAVFRQVGCCLLGGYLLLFARWVDVVCQVG